MEGESLPTEVKPGSGTTDNGRESLTVWELMTEGGQNYREKQRQVLARSRRDRMQMAGNQISRSR